MKVFIVAAVIIFGLCAALLLYTHIQRRIIRRERKYDRKQDFVDYFVGKGISESLILSVYDYFERLEGFPVRPDDDIGRVYGVVGGDIGDMVTELAEAIGRTVPVDGVYPGRLNTVEDLVRLLTTLPSL